MTAKMVEDPWNNGWSQAPFDSRITTLPMLSTGSGNAAKQLQQGYIKQVLDSSSPVPAGAPPGFAIAKTLSFLYNPSSLSVSHHISTSDAAADPLNRTPTDQSVGTILGATGTSVSFTLLFDRTYETSNPNNFGQRVAEQGVAVDVNALYAITGVLDSLSATDVANLTTQPSAGPAQSPNASKAESIALSVIKGEPKNLQSPSGIDLSYVTQSTVASLNASSVYKQLAVDITKELAAQKLFLTDLPTAIPAPAAAPDPTLTNLLPPGDYFGYMQMKRVIAVFGTMRQNWNPALEYYGWIDSMNIEYTHWTQNMVPVRCTVDINMNLWGTSIDKVTSVANGGFYQ